MANRKWYIAEHSFELSDLKKFNCSLQTNQTEQLDIFCGIILRMKKKNILPLLENKSENKHIEVCWTMIVFIKTIRFLKWKIGRKISVTIQAFR